MHLTCKVCGAIQPVSQADEADEDARTQFIRRTFRADHVASCGEGAVKLMLQPVTSTSVDPAIWTNYLATCAKPIDVTEQADGYFSRTIQRDGQTHQVRVCEDCWENIPRYVDYPAGLISPESDGAAGTVPKLRQTMLDTADPNRAPAAEHLWKAVCLPCYYQAFERVYGKPSAQLSAAVVGDGQPVEPPPVVDATMLGRVSLSRSDLVAV